MSLLTKKLVDRKIISQEQADATEAESKKNLGKTEEEILENAGTC